MIASGTFTSRSTTSSDRRRVLDLWHIASYPANDPNITVYRLKGFTIEEADGTRPPCRITETSPIVACYYNAVKTASGSVYYLTENPLEGQAIHSQEQYIAPEFLNTWVSGNNWLTI